MALLIPASGAFAWNETGHMAIALLAWQQMDAGTRQRVTEILKHHPHYKIYLNADVPPGVDPGEWAFLRAAAWPDWIRPAYPDEAPKPKSITKYHHPTWHYIDQYFVLPADKDKVTAPPAESMEPTDHPTNAIQAINLSIEKLKDPETSDEDRAIYLAWLEHLIGDIHQPLHAACEISTRFPKGDKGGNSQAILVDGHAMNLHAFWDDSLGTDSRFENLKRIAARVTDNDADRPSALPQLKKDQTPASWADESYRLAVQYAYLNGNLKSGRYHYGMDSDSLSPLPPGYVKNAHAVAQRRAALAGDRLSDWMEKLFK